MFKKSLLIIFVLFVVVLVSGCNKQQENQITEEQPIQQEEKKAEETLEEQNEATNQEKPETTKEENLVYYKIPELGIKFKIEKELASELIYYIEVAPDDSRFVYLNFSSRELSKLGEYCRAKHSPMGTLIKVEGSLSDYPDNIFIQNRKDRIKEFGDFFVYFEGPQSACSWPENLETLNRYMPLMRKSIGTPEKIKLIEKIES